MRINMLDSHHDNLAESLKNKLTQQDIQTINEYFLDSLKFISQTYQNRKNKLILALNYILKKEIDTSYLLIIEESKAPDQYFQEFGIWQHIQRIQAILDHPCPEYILDKNRRQLDLKQHIKNYIIDQVQTELTKLKQEKVNQSDLKICFTISEFQEAVKKHKTLPKNARLEIAAGYMKQSCSEAITWLAEQIENGNCPEGLIVEFIKSVDDESFIRLTKALTNLNCPKNLHLNFTKCSIGMSSAFALSDVLKTGLCKEGLSIDISERGLGYSRGIGSFGAKALAEALESDKCPKNFTLNIKDNNIGIDGQLAIMKTIAQGHCPANFEIDFLCVANEESMEIYSSIQSALTNGHFPAKVPLVFYLGEKTLPGLKAIITGLQSEKSPSGLRVYIRSNQIHRIENDELISIEDNLGNGLAIEMAKGIIAGKFPANLTLDIAYNHIEAKGAKELAKAMVHPNCPEGLTISLSNEIGIEGAEAIKHALASGKCPPGLKINYESVEHNEINNEIKKILKEGEKAYGHLAAERIMVLYQSKRKANSNSAFFPVPNELLNKIAENVEPYQSKERLNHVSHSITPEIYKQILPLTTQLCKFKVLPTTMLDKIKVADKLNYIGKTQLEFTPDIKFSEIQLIAKKLQASGLECQAFKGSQKPHHINVNMDLETAKTIIHIPPEIKDKVFIYSHDSAQGKTTIQFSEDAPWRDIQDFERAIKKRGFECVAHHGFSTSAYIKIDLEKLCSWLQQKCFATKNENNWYGLFPSVISYFTNQPTVNQKEMNQAPTFQK